MALTDSPQEDNDHDKPLESTMADNGRHEPMQPPAAAAASFFAPLPIVHPSFMEFAVLSSKKSLPPKSAMQMTQLSVSVVVVEHLVDQDTTNDPLLQQQQQADDHGLQQQVFLRHPRQVKTAPAIRVATGFAVASRGEFYV